MQSIKKFDTHLPKEGYWIMVNDDNDKILYSSHINEVLESLNVKCKTLVSLLKNTSEGKWPAHILGKLFSLSALDISIGTRIFTLKPTSPEEIASLLKNIYGDEIFILTSSQGEILAVSEKAASLFEKKSDLMVLFDSLSSGAIQAALKRCQQYGSADDFLVGLDTGKTQISNFTLSMKAFPAAGKLIFCKFTVPSVAVVTRTINRNSLVGVLLEESFTPAFIMNQSGIITSMNEIARGVCQQMWGVDPTGSDLFNYVHPTYKKALQIRHEQRALGFSEASRFPVKLLPSLSGSELSVDISIVPIPEIDQYVVFARTKSSILPTMNKKEKDEISPVLMKLLSSENLPINEILEVTSLFLGASSAAYIREGKIQTIGDSRYLIKILDPVQLAASPCGFREDDTFLQRIHSGFSISHLIFQGISKKRLKPLDTAVLHAASGIIALQESKEAISEGHGILSTVKDLAKIFLDKTQPLEGLLSDLTKACKAETAVIYRLSPKGTALKGVSASGVIGLLPELQVEDLNTASWACIRGETAFFAETPGDNLRFSPVFSDSRSELAVPYFNGSTTEGVILLASTETEAFHYVEREMIQMMALLFTTPESTAGSNDFKNDFSAESNLLKQEVLNYITHNITALYSVLEVYLKNITNSKNPKDTQEEHQELLFSSVTKLGFFSRWTLWWLKVSVYNGLPNHRWIDPIPLLEKVFFDFQKISYSCKLQHTFNPPRNDIEVCTDGAFVSMIAYSLLMCVLDYCEGCEKIDMTIKQRGDHWSFGLKTTGGSVPSECLVVDKQPGKINMAFALAWKLTEELGGTINTFTNKGKNTQFTIRLKVSG